MQDTTEPRAIDWLGAALLALMPQAFALLAFLCGGVLLATSAFPALAPRMAALTEVAPLLVVELSHFLGSIIGLLLLVVAAGLWRKQEGALFAALVLLAAGAALALARGLDYEEASLLGAVAIGLWLCRKAFVRQSRLTHEPLTLPWFAGIAATLVGVAALGFFAYREIAYSDELWWTFLRDGDASRFLRAGIGVAIAALLIAAQQMLGAPRTAHRGAPTADDLARAKRILETAKQRRPDAWLALSADKDFLFSPSGETFLMFRARGRRWIAMGEPCGKPEEAGALYWAFAEAADAAGAHPVFYALRGEALAPVAEMGFIARKIGETALVRTADFSLEGKARQNLRTTRNKLTREGCTFEVTAATAEMLPALRTLSNEWLATHGGAEKRFSMGSFNDAYLVGAPIALVRQGDAIVAFANLWLSAGTQEIAIDLMRHSNKAPSGVMDFLFLNLIAWAKEQGASHVDLGMAPLAGLTQKRLAPALSQIGAAVYAEGERVYGFRGLRAYKAKFDPDWRARSLAAPPGVALPFALLDVALLTSGGWAGMLGLKR